MGTLTCHLSDLKIKRFGTIELRNEVYLVTLGMDKSLESNYVGDANAVAELISDGFKAFNKYAIVGLTPVFTRIRRGDSLNILGDGILLYGPKDPGGKIMIHTAIMESDSRSRNISETLKNSIEKSGLFDVIESIDDLTKLTAPQIAAITAATRFAFEAVIFGLKENRDDVISTFHYSSVDMPERGYALPPNGYWEVDDRYIQGHMKVVWREN
jgi:hypothetical protein